MVLEQLVLAITKQILKEKKHELYLIKRCNINLYLDEFKEIKININGDINIIKEKLENL